MTEDELIRLIDSRIERAFDVWIERACKIEGERLKAILDRKPRPTFAELDEIYRSSLEWVRYFSLHHADPAVREEARGWVDLAERFQTRIVEPKLRKLERQR